MLQDIQYDRILQPQEDGYDIQVFQEIKKSQGYVPIDYPTSMAKFHGKVAVLPRSEQDLKYINGVYKNNNNHVMHIFLLRKPSQTTVYIFI